MEFLFIGSCICGCSFHNQICLDVCAPADSSAVKFGMMEILLSIPPCALQTMDGTQQVCQPTPRHSRDTGQSNSSTHDG